ncbi:CBS domain-containing protein [Bradyrhizobium sp. HKCCYLS1011]|uniref:CBS domain-containing protein n=1 Tax=Bradyrhizobium sp. HKCCYLS1011 TaxID=3420733 RepID=UPI003EBD0D3A
MRAHQIMSRSVITVTPGTPIVEAAKVMLRNHIGALPVVDTGGKLVGIVTDGDFIRRAEIGTARKRGRWLGLLVGRGRINADFIRSHGRAVCEIMTPDPVTVSENATLPEIVGLMERKHVKRLPVVSGNRLVGIVSYRDFVQAITDLATELPGPTPSDDILRGRILDALDRAACSIRRVNVVVRDSIASLNGAVRDAKERQAAVVAAKSVAGIKDVRDYMWVYPPPEEDFGGGDLVSLQEEPSTDDDQPL